MFVYLEEQAPHEKMVIKNCLAENRPYPKAIQTAPEVENDELFFFNAFSELSTTRNFELGYIPYTAIKDYANQFNIEHEQFERLLYVIRQIDYWLIDYIVKKNKKSEPALKSKAKGRK